MKNKKQTVHSNRHIDCILNVTDGHMLNIITIFQNNAKDHAKACAEGKVHPEAKKNAIEFYDSEFPLNRYDYYQMIRKADTSYSRMILNYLDGLFFFVFDELLPIYKAKKEEVGSVYEYNSKHDNKTPVFWAGSDDGFIPKELDNRKVIRSEDFSNKPQPKKASAYSVDDGQTWQEVK